MKRAIVGHESREMMFSIRDIAYVLAFVVWGLLCTSGCEGNRNPDKPLMPEQALRLPKTDTENGLVLKLNLVSGRFMPGKTCVLKATLTQ